MEERIKKISSESLKRVIIRFDYMGTSSTSIQPWIEKLKKETLYFFQNYDEAECGSLSLDLSHPENLTMESGVSINEMTKGPLHLFQNGKLDGFSDRLKLEISHTYMVLTIDCIDYRSSEPYRDLMNKLLVSLVEHDKFVRIMRFAIRKLDLFEFNDIKLVEEVLSTKVMNLDLQLSYEYFITRNFSDKYVLGASQDKVILMDYRRLLRHTRSKESNLFQIIIDMECVLDECAIIRQNLKNLSHISEELNSHLYDFFVNSLTDNYKEAHEKR